MTNRSGYFYVIEKIKARKDAHTKNIENSGRRFFAVGHIDDKDAEVIRERECEAIIKQLEMDFLEGQKMKKQQMDEIKLRLLDETTDIRQTLKALDHVAGVCLSVMKKQINSLIEALSGSDCGPKVIGKGSMRERPEGGGNLNIGDVYICEERDQIFAWSGNKWVEYNGANEEDENEG